MPPGSPERKDVLQRFAQRDIRFICNFGILTEGWDCDFVSVVAMGRPTKSRLVYEQMLGRVLRPLNGVVDGYADAADRKMSILRSDKPFATCIDFVGNTSHSLVSVQDVLGGNYDLETRERAKENARASGLSADAIEQLRKAKAELLLESEQKARRAIRAKVEYSVQATDPFGHNDALHVAPPKGTRGGSTDAQIAYLVNLGVQRDVAAGYSKKKAAAVIDDISSKRCTKKQWAILQKYGEDPNVGVAEASEMIDAIARRGWTTKESP